MAAARRDDFDECICRICYTNEANSCLLPCGHICICYDCATSSEFMTCQYSKMQCPMCRSVIRTVYKTFRVPLPASHHQHKSTNAATTTSPKPDQRQEENKPNDDDDDERDGAPSIVLQVPASERIE
eukprot:TRINITY_DN1936_c0_g2_i1.p1 TRINITY_DN1936_c0_g2~~TRINITY_DN1936_c0_g2_i1.p1  ORF type:complete len:137 (-),score=15.24 TRINITY_DN1936_c0_g2_i1:20-400(-)